MADEKDTKLEDKATPSSPKNMEIENTPSSSTGLANNTSTTTGISTADSEQRSSPSTVTSSSPTQPVFNSQAYHQQLHEAMMAFDSHEMSHSLMAAAAAAMAAAVGSPSSNQVTNQTQHPPPPSSQPQQQQLQQHEQQKDIDQAKRESIRTANRERKKKWRLHNEERNKDNDLRCRVNKRASKLFGTEDSEAKRQWVEEEFTKRREKRQEKERRKDVVDTALSSATNLTQEQQQAADELAQSFAAYPAVFDASKILEIPSDLQRHLLEQLNLALTNSKLPTPPIEYTQHSETVAETSTTLQARQQQDLPTDSKSAQASDTSAAAAAAAAELLAATTSVSIPPSSSIPAASPSSESQSKPQQPQPQPQLLSSSSPPPPPSSSSSSPSPSSSSTSVEESRQGKDKGNSIDRSIAETDLKNEGKKDLSDREQQETNGKKQEYPMDAVLTLMQLNAGWKK